jgi:hypothetical protein
MTSPLYAVDSMFKVLKRGRRSQPIVALRRIGDLSELCLHQLRGFPSYEIAWSGSGSKKYIVFEFRGKASRGINDALFVQDPAKFAKLWASFVSAVESSRGAEKLSGIAPDVANRCVYAALMAFSAYIDLVRPNNGQPGTYLEMIVGPTISVLSGRVEKGAIQVPIRGTGLFDQVTVDLSFPSSAQDPDDEHWLVLPTKMSTRERISQAYVHHRILTAAEFGRFNTVLCAANETNKTKTGLTETLVHRTIASYERYVAQLFALVYLDPPTRYLEGLPGMPPVMNLGDFLARSLPEALRDTTGTT